MPKRWDGSAQAAERCSLESLTLPRAAARRGSVVRVFSGEDLSGEDFVGSLDRGKYADPIAVAEGPLVDVTGL